MSEVYVVTMYLDGNREAMSYVLGVFADFATATEAADREVCDRYAPEILATPINDADRGHVVLHLPSQIPHVMRRLADIRLHRRLREVRYA